MKLSSLVLMIAVCCASHARAHAPVELLQFVSTRSSNVVLATNRGLIFGDLLQHKFSLLCNAALGLGTSEPYRVAELDDGTLIVASSGGMRRSRDRGCSFEPIEALRGLSTPALAQHPAQPRGLYATTYGNGMPAQAAVTVSDDGGESWRTLSTVGDNDYLGSLLLVPGDPPQLYVSATVIGVGSEPYTYYTACSRDGGATWTKSAVTLEPDELDLTLLAANPAHPDELLARATASNPYDGERLLWSRDGGQTWSSPLKVRVLSSAAFSTDGSAAFAAGVDGVLRAEGVAGGFTRFSNAERISQLQYDGSGLSASGYYAGIAAGLDGVALASMGSTVLTGWMHFNEVTQPAHCAGPSRADAICESLWRDWQIENPPPRAPIDGGVAAAAAAPVAAPALTADAGMHASFDAALAGREPAASGCALGEAESNRASLIILAALMLFRRARRTRQRAVS